MSLNYQFVLYDNYRTDWVLHFMEASHKSLDGFRQFNFEIKVLGLNWLNYLDWPHIKRGYDVNRDTLWSKWPKVFYLFFTSFPLVYTYSIKLYSSFLNFSFVLAKMIILLFSLLQAALISGCVLPLQDGYVPTNVR